MKEIGIIRNYELGIRNLERMFLFLFLLLIPTQLGRHFWPEWSSVMGVRVDYLSPTIYLVDIVWVGWIGIKIIRNYELGIRNWKKILNFQNILVLLYIVLNILMAGNYGVVIYRWLRLFQLAVSYKILSGHKEYTRNLLVKLIPIWLIVEVGLGVAQVANGGSLQGWWYWLGERRFAYSGIGVAQISWLGNGVVRSYGTFSHPNSLAGFLLLAIFGWIKLNKKKDIKWWIVVLTGMLGLLISGSRVVWLAFLGVLIILNRKKINFYVAGLIAVLVVTCGVGLLNMGLVGGWDVNSLEKRLMLDLVAIKMFKYNIFFGVGAGNFVNLLKSYQTLSPFYWLQPVHNIFLLWLAEMGVLGTLLLGKFIILPDTNLGNNKFKWIKRNWLLVGIIVFTGMFDHYWLTLPQNSWLAIIVLAIL